MRNLMYKFNMFMQGRYGFDQLNLGLIILSIVVDILFGFFPFPLSLLKVSSLGLLIWAIFRALSKNIYKRSQENRKFLPFYNKIADWFKLTYKKFRDGKTHRYYKCPHCKASLRVKYLKGTHTIKCPKCSKQFQKKIY